jgi:hypothetical protein
MKTLAAQLAEAAAKYERLVRLHGPRARRSLEAYEAVKAIRNRMLRHENRGKKRAA